MPRTYALALAAATMFSSSALAAPILWISDENRNLVRVDAATGAAAVVGRSSVVLTDIAFDGAGALWGISFDRLYRVDQTTAALSDVGALGFRGNSLAFDAAGTLYAAADSSRALYTLNLSTGAGTAIGDLGETASGDLAFVGSQLFVTLDTSFQDTLGRVNLNPGGTSTATRIGTGLGQNRVYGLAGVGDTLYGVDTRTLFTIDTSTGVASQIAVYDYAARGRAHGMTYLAAAAVPEPATWISMIAGFGLVGVALRRRLRLMATAG